MHENARFDSALAEVVTISLPADHAYVSVVEACVGELLDRQDLGPGREATVYNTRLAIHEACTNIIDHAYGHQAGGRIDVVISLADLPARLVVELRDTGEPFMMDDLATPDLSEPREGGYGLFLMKTLLDRVDHEWSAAGNRWHLVKNLQ